NGHAVDVEAAFGRRFGDRRIHDQTDDAVRLDRGGELEANAELLERIADLALVHRGRHRELAAGKEFGLLAGKSGEVRLGQGADGGIAFEGAELRTDGQSRDAATDGEAVVGQDVRGAAHGWIVLQADRGAADDRGAVEIDAQLLDC